MVFADGRSVFQRMRPYAMVFDAPLPVRSGVRA